MLYNLLNHSHIVDISIASNFSLFLTTLQLTFLYKNLLPYFLILTWDRFTYVGLQSQRIQIFCNRYYEPSNVVFLFCFTCGLFQAQCSSFPRPFWILILSLDTWATPSPSKAFPSSSQADSRSLITSPGYAVSLVLLPPSYMHQCSGPYPEHSW